MDRGKILGFSQIKQYTSKKTGETYPTIDIYVGLVSPSVTGMITQKCWMRVNPTDPIMSYDWVELNVEVELHYNRYGSVEKIEPVV